jgi:hypothetical protein
VKERSGPWTGEETYFLLKNRHNMKLKDIAAALGRDAKSVRAKIKNLKTAEMRESLSENRHGCPIPGETLCWSCARAGGFGAPEPCAWIRDFEPVEGWTAVKTNAGYHVFECPEIVRGKERNDGNKSRCVQKGHKVGE